jgi:hypothetical protein
VANRGGAFLGDAAGAIAGLAYARVQADGADQSPGEVKRLMSPGAMPIWARNTVAVIIPTPGTVRSRRASVLARTS